jgi:hypothetical protein
MVSAVSEEDALTRAKTEFTGIVWPQVWPTRAAENAQVGVIDGFLEQLCDRGCVLNDTAWHSIYEITCCEDGIVPKTEGSGRLGEEG